MLSLLPLALLVPAIVPIIIAFRNTELLLVVLIGLIVRILMLSLTSVGLVLPDSTADAIYFLEFAASVARSTWGVGLDSFPGYYSGLGYSWWIGMLWQINPAWWFLPQLISVIFGISTISLAYSVSRDLWDKRAAKISSFLIALYPTLVLYSVLSMREVFFSFFFALAVFFTVRFYKRRSFVYVLGVASAYVAAGFFHGAALLGMFVTLIGFFFWPANLKVRYGYLKIRAISFLALAFLFFLYKSSYFSIPYVSAQTLWELLERALIQSRIQSVGVASYPDFLSHDNPIIYLITIPLRFLYFLVSPFPWEIRSFSHFLGLFDGLFYAACIYKVIFLLPKNKNIFFLIFFILISFFLVYAVGTGNFGTGLRHRSKFLVILICLACPSFFKKRYRKSKVE